MQLADGKVVRQYNKDGKENTWKDLPLQEIVRVSFVPALPVLPTHDCLIDISAGEHFEKRFGKGFISNRKGSGYSLIEYVNCCSTNRYRLWVFHSSGKALVTRSDYEVRI